MREIAAVLRALIKVAAASGAIALMTAVSACAAPMHFSILLSESGGLGPGDPLMHSGATIGSITATEPAGPDTTVSVQVNGSDASEVHMDSIMLLNGAGTAPSLELISPDPSSPRAGEGALIYGAANQQQAQMLMSTLGPPTIVNRYAQWFSQMSPPGSAPTPAPGSTALQSQLLNIFNSTIAAATSASRSNPVGAAQYAQFQSDAASVERQLIAHGRSADADKLRQQVDRMNTTTAPPPPANRPNVGVVPRAVPSP